MAKEPKKSSRTTFELASGRMIRLLALDQCGTYEGLLAGIPPER